MSDQPQRAPPPAAFPVPPPPAASSMGAAGSGYPSQYGAGVQQSQQTQQRPGYTNYQRQSSGPSGGQHPPALAAEGPRRSVGSAATTAGSPVGGGQQFAPSPAVTTYVRSGSASQQQVSPVGGIGAHMSKPACGTTSGAVASSGVAAIATSTTAAAPAMASGSSTTQREGQSSLYPSSYTTSQYPSSYTASQYPSPYLSTPAASGDSTLKARNVSSGNGGAANQGASQGYEGYLLTKPPIADSRKTPKAAASTAGSPGGNNKSIALLLIPPLLFVFLHEMSSSLPLLVFLCLGLVVYSFDLANVGDGSKQSRGFYTLCAIWMGWTFLSLVVGYDAIFLGEDRGSLTFVQKPSADSPEGMDGVSGEMEASIGYGKMANLLGLGLLLSKVAVAILLLFHLAAWTTLQFDWLPLQMPLVARFLEQVLHSTLPPVSASIFAYGLFAASSMGTYGLSLGVDNMATLAPHLFAFHLTLGILLVGAAPSMLKPGSSELEDAKGDGKGKEKASKSHRCAIHPREGRRLSYLLVFVPALVHFVTFRQRITYSYASWDDLFDLVLIATLPYTLHYLLASNGVFDEWWRRSLPWVLQVGTSPGEERTLRGASVPMAVSLLAAMAFQHRYLVPLCARLSYIINGHDGVISASWATSFLTLGTVLAYITVWFFGRKDANGNDFLLGEYHEDAFQGLLALSSISYGMSCSPKWTFLPVPMLFAESIALWVITKQLRYAFLMAFVCFTVLTILVSYRLTFLSEAVEIFPGRTIVLKRFAEVALYSSLWLMVLVGLVCRAPGGYGARKMRKYDVTGICLTAYGIMLVVMEFALLREPMPLYSRDNFEVGRVAVYSPGIAYFTGFLTIVLTWHMKAQKRIQAFSVVASTSIGVGKMLAVLLESSSSGGAGSSTLKMLYLRWAVASLLLVTMCTPRLLQPIHVKMTSFHSKKRLDPSAKPSSGMERLPKNASWTVLLYCCLLLPAAIVASVRLVMEPLIGLLTGQTGGGAAPKLSEIIGYSASLWGVSVLSMINHFLPDGGAEVWRRVSALTFVTGLFVSFAAPAFPGDAASSTWDDGNMLFQSLSSLDAENDVATGGWGLVSAFLAILLAMSGPLELREIRDASGRRDARQLLRLMIFGMMFGCGLSWFITMQSMSKDIFIPIFVTTFACMAMSTLGTVAAVMGYFLDSNEFVEAEQIANVWTIVAFPVFFVISSISLSAHCQPFGIGGWASTYLSVCGLLSGAFCVMVRLREEKTSTTRGYGNMSCVISWLCTVVVVYGRYGVAGVGVVGTTSVAGIPASVLGTILCSPILCLLEGEGGSGGSSGRKKYQASSTRSKKKGLVLPSLGRRNWFAPLLAGTVGVFLAASVYAIFLRGCGLSKFSFLFGAGGGIRSQEDVFSRPTGVGKLDDVAKMARKSVVHTRTMVAAAKLSGSGIWTSSNLLGPLLHLLALVATLPSLRFLVGHSWSGSAPSAAKVRLALPLNLLALFFGRGIPGLLAAAAIGLVGGALQSLALA
ncbi:hypothetical protein ACHAXT_012801 [Thalassiosira profunda]